MNNYRVNKNTSSNPNGDNEVHKDTCRHYNELLNYESLGAHSSCSNAVSMANRNGYKADGCKNCIPECNKG